jgi:hypothetical protein
MRRLRQLGRINRRWLLLSVPIMLLAAYFVFRLGSYILHHIGYSPTEGILEAYLTAPDKHPELITDRSKPCPNAPFQLPSTGFVGFLYNDPTEPYTILAPHTGVDIFGDGDVGTVPVYAASDGYLTRLPDWISSVIVRIPHDPLDPSRQIWTYYAHMASLNGDQSYIVADFPPGTSEKFVKQGTLLGYQGLYAGVGAAPIKMHVHFSVVLSDDSGSFRNETRIQNTLDPSPYLGFNVNTANKPVIPVQCGV